MDPSPALSFDEEQRSYFHRMKVDTDNVDVQGKIVSFADKDEIKGVYVDPQIIKPFGSVCPDGSIGSDKDVQKRLSDPLHTSDLTGEDVDLAVVDTGVNVQYLRDQMTFDEVTFDKDRSWSPRDLTPGEMEVSHGTMVAYDALLVSPDATLIDVPLLSHPDLNSHRSLLSEAILAFDHLVSLIEENKSGKGNPSLVVNNSWGLYRTTDRIMEHYVKNPDHPFNRMVEYLESKGADICFAAGNCGSEACGAGGRCERYGRTIYGANGHSKVTTVGACTVEHDFIEYSSRGPGYLNARRKPDVCGYSHFKGSGVFSADTGTSAASPVIAGTLASMRSERPLGSETDGSDSPEALRSILRKTARDQGPAGFDTDWGYGIVNGPGIVSKIKKDGTDDNDDSKDDSKDDESGEEIEDPPKKRNCWDRFVAFLRKVFT